jgi:hypothetical protein
MISAIFAAGLLFMQAQPTADPATAPAAAPTPSGHAVSPLTVTSRKQQSGDLNPAEVVCHSESVIGSRFPKKVCASRRELAERRQEDQATTENFNRGTLNGGQPK